MLLKFLKTICVTFLTNILKKTKSRCQQKTCVLTTRAFVFYYGNLRHRLFKVWVDCICPAQNRIRWSISKLTFYVCPTFKSRHPLYLLHLHVDYTQLQWKIDNLHELYVRLAALSAELSDPYGFTDLVGLELVTMPSMGICSTNEVPVFLRAWPLCRHICEFIT